MTGRNADGQLGDGTSASRSTGVQVATNVTAVFAGDHSTFWIKSDGTLWATGENSSGQLGDGAMGTRYSPMQIATNVAAVAGGHSHTAFIKTDRTLWTMGSNSGGQLGTGTDTFTLHSTPGQIATDVTAVAAGSGHTLFLKADETLWGMGNNYSGQLGDRSPQSVLTPKQIASDVIAIAAGGAHTLFVKRDGTLWAMGENRYGQLGDGTTSLRSAPVQIATDVQAVAAGENHSLFLKTDGSLWGVGANWNRQLGIEGSSNQYTPVQVRNDVVFITAGGEHTLFKTRDGALWASGSNIYNEFGLDSLGTPPAQVKVVGAPELTIPPIDKTVNPDLPVTFSVTAWGAGPLSYQWRRNGQNIPGATASSYSLRPKESDEGSFDVIVSNRDGTTTSAAVNLSVNDPVVITDPPESLSRMPGQSAIFRVSATGTGPLYYQWRKNTTNIAGAVGPVLSIASVSAADGGTYACVVSNSVTTVPSNVANLTVGPSIIDPPQNKTVNPGTPTTFTVTASGTSLTYQWRRNGVAIPGAISSTYTFTAVEAHQGNYDVVVSNSAGSLTTNAFLLRVNDPVLITSEPQSINTPPRQAASLAVTATGEGNLSYQWQKNGIPIPGATKTALSFASISAADSGTYTCSITNVVGTVVSASAEIRVSPEITVQPVSQTVNPGTRVHLSVEANGTGQISYEWRRNGVVIATGSMLTVLSASEEDEGEYTVLVSNAAGTVLSERATLLVNDLPKITTQPQAQEAVKGAVVTFGVQAHGTGVIRYQWRKNGVELAYEDQSFLLIGPVDETNVGTYDVIVTDSIGRTTSSPANLSLNLRPRIIREPASLAARPGATVTLSVEAAGAGPLSYQWIRNGEVFAYTTSAALTIESLSADSIGDYRVRISNESGSVLSSTAVVSFAEWQAVAGTYQGLLVSENAGEADASPWSGRLTITATNAGAFSGRFEYEGQTLSFSGVLNKDFSFEKTFIRKSQSPLVLKLQLDGANETMQAAIESGALVARQTATLSAARHVFHAKKNPAPQAGRYVVALIPSPETTDVPTAPGYATIQISAGGAVSMVGKLPDGAKIAIGGYVGEDSVFGCYQSLYRPVYPESGQLVGLMSFEPTPSLQAVGGSLHWWKPKQVSGLYSSGFQTLISLRGTFYVPPNPGEAVMEAPQGSSGLFLSVEDPQQQLLFQRSLTLSTRNAFQIATPNPEKAALKLDIRTGLIRGTFFESATRKTRVMEGVVIPPSAEAFGFFTTPTQSGSWSVSPF